MRRSREPGNVEHGLARRDGVPRSRAYLRAAFLFSPTIPSLGKMPLNLVLVLCFVILGFGYSGFWLLGLGLEIAYLAWLSTHPLFRRWVDQLDSARGEGDAEVKRSQLIAGLDPESRRRLTMVTEQCERVVHLYEAKDDAASAASNREALRWLLWTYLKLLIARRTLCSGEGGATEAELRAQINQLKDEVSSEDLPSSTRESKDATLGLLVERLEMLDRREDSLERIESDLMRIETQVALAMEKAALPGDTEATSYEIEVASQVLAEDLFGEDRSAVADLDATFKRRE